jgi:hypothetical protein
MNPLAGVLGEAWQLYRTHAKHLLAIAFVIYLIAALLAALLSLAGTFGSVLGAIVSACAAFVLQATLIKAVQDVRSGRSEMSIGATVSAVLPFLVPVGIASILAGVAIWIGFLLLVVPGLFLLTIWAVIIPVIVIERSDALASFGRSQQLVRGRGWYVFGTLVLVWLALVVASFVLVVIFAVLPLSVRDGLSTVIAGTVIAPYLAIIVTLIYYRLAGDHRDNAASVWS